MSVSETKRHIFRCDGGPLDGCEVIIYGARIPTRIAGSGNASDPLGASYYILRFGDTYVWTSRTGDPDNR